MFNTMEYTKDDISPSTIAFVVDDVSQKKNGTTMSALRYAEELRAKGYEIRIVSHGAEGPWGYAVPKMNIPLVTFIADKQNFIFGKPDDRVFARAFEGVDLVHLYMPFPLEKHALQYARAHHIPVSAGFHVQPENLTYNAGLAGNMRAAQIIYHEFNRYFYHGIRHVHCPSKFMALQLERMGYTNTLHVISNGVTDKFTPGTPAHPFTDGLFHILTVGRLATEKDQETIIRAIPYTKHPEKIQLHIAGKGPLFHELSRIASRLALPHAPEIAFYPTDDLVDLIRACDLYVHASIVDSESISCIEASACGLVPVISDSPLSAASQFAYFDENLFPAKNARALAKRIDFWMEHPTRKQEVSTVYVQKAEEYRLPRCIDAFCTFMDEAVRDDANAYAHNEM